MSCPNAATAVLPDRSNPISLQLLVQVGGGDQLYCDAVLEIPALKGWLALDDPKVGWWVFVVLGVFCRHNRECVHTFLMWLARCAVMDDLSIGQVLLSATQTVVC